MVQEDKEMDQSAEDAAEVERFLDLLADGHDLPPDERTVRAQILRDLQGVIAACAERRHSVSVGP